MNKVSRGTLLIPNDYMVRNGDVRFALVLQVVHRGTLPPDYEVLFSDGFINRISTSGITSLYNVMEVEP